MFFPQMHFQLIGFNAYLRQRSTFVITKLAKLTDRFPVAKMNEHLMASSRWFLLL